MKLLKVVANGFKLCENDFTICFVPKANKSKDDKEFELINIDDGLYTFNTLGIIGKNASGKTMTLELLSITYDILSFFRINRSKNVFNYINNMVNLDITFYHEGYLYRYICDLIKDNDAISYNVLFKNEKLYKRKYYKSYVNSLFDYSKYELVTYDSNLPEDTSILFNLLNKIRNKYIFYSSNDSSINNYSMTFNLYESLNLRDNMVKSILKIFDEHILDIKKIDDRKYLICYSDLKNKEVTDLDLYNLLSSGTTKGINLFAYVLYSLTTGSDLLVDEIENHFHKTLVEYLINLYKDKNVNKLNATLIFTTHYCELLDLFNRNDNIYICKYDDKIRLENMYETYNFRCELSKSNKFYENAFDTNVNYESLMNLKRKIMTWHKKK